MSEDGRFELKYLLSPPEYESVVAVLRTCCRHDPFARRSPSCRYLVRSLYFDTLDLKAYADKVTGERNRRKIRIRSYANHRSAVEAVHLEEKIRLGGLIYKTKTALPLAEYENVEKRWDFGIHAVGHHLLRPSSLVAYHREAFIAMDGSTARYTFDHDIRALATDDVFAPLSSLRRDPANRIVFEVKFGGRQPEMLSRLVRAFDLKVVPNSKYANAVNQGGVNTVWLGI
ncbi:MAG: polyphosphate polymerase domain-containing protein [Alphaproteobacteria bacterium]|nr:polyphosphate polymerase domain-containing protein [Alphaproteobacteria bacterium]